MLNSMVWPAIKAEEDTLDAILSTIRPFFDDKSIRSVAVFGIAAKGLEGKQSDIDIFIVADDRELASERVAAASAETASKFGFGLSPLIMDESTFARKKNKDLGRSILEFYRMVRGKDLRKIGDVQARQ